MSILVDFSQVFISAIHVQIATSKNGTTIDEDLVRHLVLSNILHYKKRFGKKYGNLIFCFDSKTYWRKSAFKYYKSGRKKVRDDSGLDWKAIFNSLNKIKNELKENFPYKFIEVDNAEGDDVIAVACKVINEEGSTVQVGLFEEPEPILILSSDKDFLQLQKYSNVEQYSPIVKKFIRTENPEAYLKEHIIRGDSGDGIPNFLSDDDTFDSDKRQKGIQEIKLAKWLEQEPEDFCTTETLLRNFKRNEMLVDLSKIPKDVEARIREELAIPAKPKKSTNLLRYFMDNKLKLLSEELQNF